MTEKLTRRGLLKFGLQTAGLAVAAAVVCPYCGVPKKLYPASGKCPECGGAFGAPSEEEIDKLCAEIEASRPHPSDILDANKFCTYVESTALLASLAASVLIKMREEI